MKKPVRHLQQTFLVGWALALLLATDVDAQQPLSGTRPLTWEEEGAELAVRMMDGAHRYIDRRIASSTEERPRFWNRDTSSAEAYVRSIGANRQRFAEIIGAAGKRRPAAMRRFGSGSSPGLVADLEAYRVWQVRWPVLEHVWGEGLLVEPTGDPVGHVVVVPDAGQTPEGMLGLDGSGAEEVQAARRLAEHGFAVVIPTLVSRERQERGRSGAVQSDREWIFRQAFHMGRHIVGFEVQKVLAAVDWFEEQAAGDPQVGVAGYAEGGLVAFYAAAVDSRIDAALVSGYFESRRDLWREPIYRQVWGLLRQFGDAEIASLVAPRSLVVEYAPVPEINEQKGRLATPPFDEVQAEFERIRELVGSELASATLAAGTDGSTSGPMSREAVERFAVALGTEAPMTLSSREVRDLREKFDPAARQARQAVGMERHLQMLARRSADVRDRFFLYEVMPELNLTEANWSTRPRHETLSPERFVEASTTYREHYAELLGRFDVPMLSPNARSRKIIENEQWTAYDVVLDVYEDLFAWGVLLVPKDLKPDERRPVVVTQHGRNGLPRDLIDADNTAYNNTAAELAEQGFITFAPHNLYRTEERYRWLDRKAKTTRATLYSFILAQHEQILNWLSSLPFVDDNRIGFYGLSFGGQTGLRVPPILQKYALSISSGYFNEETRKVVSTMHPFSYMWTDEWEIPYWKHGHTFGHAEAAYLMVPRPFMVERGMWDLVGRDRWVAHEYAKVRFLYTQLGLRERTEIDYFQGGHSMKGEAAFDFLREHLDWPKR